MIRELDRKEDERLAREQAAMAAQLEEELRRDKVLDTAAAKEQNANAFDEQPVGAASKKNLFRAPSPILDSDQRNKNLFKAPSPIIDNNNVFRAPSPIINSRQSAANGTSQNLFDPPTPTSDHRRSDSQPNSHQSSHPSSRQRSQGGGIRHSSSTANPPSSPLVPNRHNVAEVGILSPTCVFIQGLSK